MNPTDAGVRSDRAVESSTMSHSSKFRRSNTNKAAHAFTFTPRKADTATTADRGRTGFTNNAQNFHHTTHNTLDVRNYTCGSTLSPCVCVSVLLSHFRVYARVCTCTQYFQKICVYVCVCSVIKITPHQCFNQFNTRTRNHK